MTKNSYNISRQQICWTWPPFVHKTDRQDMGETTVFCTYLGSSQDVLLVSIILFTNEYYSELYV